jgi:serine O-acetyltransferase
VKDLNDPMARALHELIGHSAELDRRIEHILSELQRLGLRIDEQEAHRLDATSLNKMVD